MNLMARNNEADLVNEQLQIIDVLCGLNPNRNLVDRIGSIAVVYDYCDFVEDDLYIEVKKEYVDKLTQALCEAEIGCERIEEIPEGAELYRWQDFPEHSKKWFSKCCKADEYVIIKTRLKGEKVYQLISDINSYETHNVRVEIIVIDTREDD